MTSPLYVTSKIVKPRDFEESIVSISGFLILNRKFTTSNNRVYHNSFWYRGVSKTAYELEPGVYREKFTIESYTSSYGSTQEDKRLNLEREILSEFREVGADFLDPNKIVDLYFLAQHYGMPTRLLDWTTNPLAALFFAVEKDDGDDGEVFLMEARKLLPEVPVGAGNTFPRNVLSMRHPYLTDAIGESFWHSPSEVRTPFILPVRPDSQSGRVFQQSSCFTMHMHNPASIANDPLTKFLIPAEHKSSIYRELLNLNINQFTIYKDLDHLSREIKRTWGI